MVVKAQCACGARYLGVPGGTMTCKKCGAVNHTPAELPSAPQPAARPSGGAFAPEQAGLDKGVLGGLAMIAVAGVWFFLGWQAGVIFYYPPVLALIGAYGVIKGLFSGNLAGRGS
jgi:hypothetical protein